MLRATAILALQSVPAASFLLPPSATSAVQEQRTPEMSRRDLLWAVPLASAAFAWSPTPAAQASGGATAGKTTSIPRAKIRYYGRMAVVLSAYNALGKAIDGGDSAEIKKVGKTFFADSEEAPAGEFKSAGYLLAVAFKIDSKIPPDKIPAVKAFKVALADFEGLSKATSSGKAEAAARAYGKSKASMAAYLEEVELPELSDGRYKDPSTACFFKCEE